jgi:thioredoxin-like negative regulator of GroEL
MGMHYKRIGREIGDLVATNRDGTESVVREGEIRLAEMEYGANRELCKRLGVKKLPSIHFYSEGKKVDGFPCGPRKLPMLLEKLTEYRYMGLEDLSFEADMNQGLELGENVLETLGSEKAKSNSETAFS